MTSLARVMTTAVVAGAMAAASVVPGMADEAPVATSAWQGPCRDALIVGARGSGEETPFGRTVGAVVTDLRDRLPAGTSVAEVYLDYPASDPRALALVSPESLLYDETIPANAYLGSATQGGQALKDFLATATAKCPHQPIALVGFSQGSEAIVRGFAAGADASDVSTVVLIGDPTNAPERGDHAEGTARPGAIGLTATLHYVRAQAQAQKSLDGQGVKGALAAVLELRERAPQRDKVASALRDGGVALPAQVAPRVHSVCLTGDMVCDAADPIARLLLKASTMVEELTTARPIHSGYSLEVLAPTLDAAGQRWAQDVRAAAPERERAREESGRTGWLWGAAVAVVAVTAGAGWVIGRSRRRARRR